MNATSSSPAECFLDTNVWLYAFISNSQPEKHTVATSLIQRQPHIVASVQVINEVSVNLVKKAAFTEIDVRNLVESFYQHYRVVTVDHLSLIRASYLRERYQFSFWDGLIVSSALAAGATILYSEDMHHGLIVEGQLTVVNPFLSTETP